MAARWVAPAVGCVCIVSTVGAVCNPSATRAGIRRCHSASLAILVPLVGRWLSWESAAVARRADRPIVPDLRP